LIKTKKIHSDYGHHRNNHFLIYSGFTIKNNKGVEDDLIYPDVKDHPYFGMWGVDLIKALVNYRKNKKKFCESLEDELNCLIIAREKVKEIIKNFGSSCEEDSKQLANNNNLSYNVMNILRVCIEEKKVL